MEPLSAKQYVQYGKRHIIRTVHACFTASSCLTQKTGTTSVKPMKSFRFEGSFREYWEKHGNARQRFMARMSRWGKNFDEFFDNLLVFQPGTPGEIAKQVVVKLIAFAIMAAGLYLFLVLGLAM